MRERPGIGVRSGNCHAYKQTSPGMAWSAVRTAGEGRPIGVSAGAMSRSVTVLAIWSLACSALRAAESGASALDRACRALCTSAESLRWGTIRMTCETRGVSRALTEDEIAARVARIRAITQRLRRRTDPGGGEDSEGTAMVQGFLAARPWIEAGRPYSMLMGAAWRGAALRRFRVAWSHPVDYPGAVRGEVVYGADETRHWVYSVDPSRQVHLYQRTVFRPVHPQATTMLQCPGQLIPRRTFEWWRGNFAFLLDARDQVRLSQEQAGPDGVVSLSVRPRRDMPFAFKARELRVVVDLSRGGCVQSVEWLRRPPLLAVTWTGTDFFRTGQASWRPRKMQLVLGPLPGRGVPAWTMRAEILDWNAGKPAADEFHFRIPPGRFRTVLDERYSRGVVCSAACQLMPFSFDEARGLRDMVHTPKLAGNRDKLRLQKEAEREIAVAWPPTWPPLGEQNRMHRESDETCEELSRRCATLDTTEGLRPSDLRLLYSVLSTAERTLSQAATPERELFLRQVMVFVYHRLNDARAKDQAVGHLVKHAAEYIGVGETRKVFAQLAGLHGHGSGQAVSGVINPYVTAVADVFGDEQLASLADTHFVNREYAVALRLYSTAMVRTSKSSVRVYCQGQLTRAGWRHKVLQSMECVMPWEREHRSRRDAVAANKRALVAAREAIGALASAVGRLRSLIADTGPVDWQIDLQGEVSTIEAFLKAREDCPV